jgi:hypothetical protein
MLMEGVCVRVRRSFLPYSCINTSVLVLQRARSSIAVFYDLGKMVLGGSASHEGHVVV